MAKESKTAAELQAIFKAELNKLGMSSADKLTIQPVSNNSRFTRSVFEATAAADDRAPGEATRETLRKALQDRYDLSDES